MRARPPESWVAHEPGLRHLSALLHRRAVWLRANGSCCPHVLCIDEVGYLSYDARYADLLFEVVTRRYNEQRPIIITTNKPFAQWPEVFPNASCVVTLVDRLIHRSEIITIEGNSYRLHEAKQRAEQRNKERKATKKKRETKPNKPTGTQR